MKKRTTEIFVEVLHRRINIRSFGCANTLSAGLLCRVTKLPASMSMITNSGAIELLSQTVINRSDSSPQHLNFILFLSIRNSDDVNYTVDE